MSEGIEGVAVAAALLSAFLHAAWNAAVKASPDATGAMAAQVIASGLIAVPLLACTTLPAIAALPWLAASSAFGLLSMVALLRGYAHGGGFGFVYPLARATSPLLVLLFSTVLQHEVVGATGIAGICLVSGGVALFAYGDGRHRRAALGYALLAGAGSAAYALCDATGARLSSSVLGYGLTASIVNAVVFGCVHALRRSVSPVAVLRAHAGLATVGAAASMTSYLLILWVWSRSPVAIGAALRDTSVVFAALIAAALGERLTLPRMAAIVLVTAGACALRFA